MGKKEKSEHRRVLVGMMGNGGRKGYHLSFLGGEPGRENVLLEV